MMACKVHSRDAVNLTIFSAGSFLDSATPLLTIAAVTALGEIGRNGELLIPSEGDGFSKFSLVENLLARITSGKESGKVTAARCTHFFHFSAAYLQG